MAVCSGRRLWRCSSRLPLTALSGLDKSEGVELDSGEGQNISAKVAIKALGSAGRTGAGHKQDTSRTGAGHEQTQTGDMSRTGAEQEQDTSRTQSRTRAGHEQDRSRTRAGHEQDTSRTWTDRSRTRAHEQDTSRTGAPHVFCCGRAGPGLGLLGCACNTWCSPGVF